MNHITLQVDKHENNKHIIVIVNSIRDKRTIKRLRHKPNIQHKGLTFIMICSLQDGHLSI